MRTHAGYFRLPYHLWLQLRLHLSQLLTSQCVFLYEAWATEHTTLACSHSSPCQSVKHNAKR